MAINFPKEPQEGDFYSSGEKKYKFSNGSWRIHINNTPQSDLYTPWSSVKDAPKIFTAVEVNELIQTAITQALSGVALKSEIPDISGLATKQQLTDLTGAGAPETLNQISELAAAINNDPNYGANLLSKVADIPYDLADYVSGKPTAGNLNSIQISTPIKFLAGMSTSKASVEVAATAATVFTLQKNGVAFATFTFATGATTGTFICNGDTYFTTNDILTIVAPTQDSTLSGLRYTLSAKLVN